MLDNLAGFYRHHSGMICYVLGVAVNMMTEEKQVVFICMEAQCNYSLGTLFYENYNHFFQESDLGDGKLERRYTKID